MYVAQVHGHYSLALLILYTEEPFIIEIVNLVDAFKQSLYCQIHAEINILFWRVHS